MVFGLEEELEMRSRASGPPFISPLSPTGPAEYGGSRGFPIPSSAAEADALRSMGMGMWPNGGSGSIDRRIAEPSRIPYQNWEGTRGADRAGQAYLAGGEGGQGEIAELRAALNEALERAEAAETAATEARRGGGSSWGSQRKSSSPELMRQLFLLPRGWNGGTKGGRGSEAEGPDLGGAGNTDGGHLTGEEAADSGGAGNAADVHNNGEETRSAEAAVPAAGVTCRLKHSGDSGCDCANPNAAQLRAPNIQEAGMTDLSVWPFTAQQQKQTSSTVNGLVATGMELQLPRVDALTKRRRFSSRR